MLAGGVNAVSGYTAPHPGRSPLQESDWEYVDRKDLESFTSEDWTVINRQRARFFSRGMADRLLQLLTGQRDIPSFGYETNTYRHCLQAASMVLRDGGSDESVVAALFHDVFLEVSDTNHGQAVAELLKPFLPERELWVLKHHGAFINLHCPTYPGIDVAVREKWRGHPYFEDAARFVERYDQTSIQAAYHTLDISEFEAIVRRVVAAPRPDRCR